MLRVVRRDSLRFACRDASGVQVDPHRGQLGAQGPHDEGVEATVQAREGELTLALTRVVVGKNVCVARPPDGAPPSTYLYAHAWIGLQVADVGGAQPVLGDDQNVSPMRPSPTGVCRGCPLRRPIVSSSA
jgi:hypothetical protein